MELYFGCLLVIMHTLLGVLLSLKIFKHIQLNGYKFIRNDNLNTYCRKVYVGVFFAVIVKWCFYATYFITQKPVMFFIGELLALIPLAMSLRREKSSCAKNSLVYTKRAVRLITVFTFLLLIINSITLLLYFVKIGEIRLTFCLSLLTTILLPQIIMLALKISVPIENKKNDRYIKYAKEKLQGKANLIKIGITGSYGKTSVKFILTQMLKEKYNVYCTPSSYNTPLGIALSVNALKGDEEIFIAEMGARNMGDIAELCEIVKPTVAIMTGISNQHLESFKTVENIIATKSELSNYVSRNGGFTVFNTDNKYLKELAEKFKGNCGSAGLIDGEVTADNIVIDDGCTFDLIYNPNTKEKHKNIESKEDIISKYTHTVSEEGNITNHNVNECNEDICTNIININFAKNIIDEESELRDLDIIQNEGDSKVQKVKCKTVLLGKHNILNILTSARAALYLGVSLDEIARAISKLTPIEHRLELVKANGINIIDDSYNSNEEGATAALEVLSSFKGRKVVCACGFVEMGDAEQRKNFELGQKIASVADIAILVGKRGQDIKQGMVSKDFCIKNIYSVEKLTHAKSLFSQILKNGDTILIENDLPDNY